MNTPMPVPRSVRGRLTPWQEEVSHSCRLPESGGGMQWFVRIVPRYRLMLPLPHTHADRDGYDTLVPVSGVESTLLIGKNLGAGCDVRLAGCPDPAGPLGLPGRYISSVEPDVHPRREGGLRPAVCSMCTRTCVQPVFSWEQPVGSYLTGCSFVREATSESYSGVPGRYRKTGPDGSEERCWKWTRRWAWASTFTLPSWWRRAAFARASIKGGLYASGG